MERKVKKLENCHVEVEVIVDQDAWKKAQEKGFKKEASKVSVDGFRKGKAPEALVKSKVNPAKVMDEAINDLLPEIYSEVLKEEKMVPYAQPKIDVVKLSETELTLKFIITTSPEVTLGTYTGHEVGKVAVTVSDEDVDNAIVDLLKQNATLVVKDGAAEKGDTVVIDFKGSIDGVEFDGGSATNYELELGSNQFIPGFEDQLVGHKSNEDVTVNVEFPKNYTKELAGKAAVFACKIHEVKAKKLPELNEDFVKELALPSIETVEALKESKKAELTKNKENQARSEYLGKLYDKILEVSKVEIPTEMIEEEVKKQKKDLTDRLAQSGLTLEQYIQIMGQSEAQFDETLKTGAIKNISEYFMLLKIAQAEKMMVTDADLETEFAKLADQYKMTVEDVKKALSKQLDDFRFQLQMSKVENFLFEQNK